MSGSRTAKPSSAHGGKAASTSTEQYLRIDSTGKSHIVQSEPLLIDQARLQFARRAHEAAFQTYQKLLSLNPDMAPDPRIGLGLCAWVLGDRERARAAWERSLQRVSQPSS